MNKKLCVKCNKEKSNSEFYVTNKTTGRLDTSCKECRKVAVRSNRLRNIEYYREYDVKRANLPHRVEARENYTKTQKGKEAKARAVDVYNRKYPNKRKAHVILGNAIRDRRLIKPDSCENCGALEKVEGHHCDYTKPLDVMWLCVPCHNEWHSNYVPYDNCLSGAQA